jgi:hypothetical protein
MNMKMTNISPIALFKANPDNKDTLAKMYDAIPELQEKVDRMWEKESNS